MTALPPTYYLHVWWARRPLVASRAAVLASLLPATADRKAFMRMIGIHGDPVAARRVIDEARRSGDRVDNPYGYDRAFSYSPSHRDKEQLASVLGKELDQIIVLDPTAGGGSVPYEAARLGLATSANDLNPVAVSVIRATLEAPLRFRQAMQGQFLALATVWRTKLEEQLKAQFPQNGLPDRVDTTYLWARAITCPYCDGLVPLSPNWHLTSGGLGVQLHPHLAVVY